MDEQSLFSGRLDHIHFPDILLEISQRREIGILRLTRQEIEKEIYFQDGRIVFAKSNDPDERLGELLLRRGKVTLPHLVDSAEKIGPGVRLGTILVQEGYLPAAELYQGVIDQVEEIVYSVFEWSDGAYEFISGDLPSKEVITLSISTPDIINMGIGRIWRWSWISKGVGPLDTLFVRRQNWNTISRKMLITPAVQSMTEMLEQPMKLEEIIQASRINSYETCKILWALLSIGMIEKLPRLEMQESPAVEPAEKPAEVPPTEIISWQPPATLSEEALSRAVFLDTEKAVASTVEISFSDLAEFTDSSGDLDFSEPERPEGISENVIRKGISKFNEMHRYLFEMLRIEMGASAANFLMKILKKGAEIKPLVFEGVRMNEYGELDAEALQASIQGNLVDDYSDAFDWLLREERTTAMSFLGRKRMEAIDSGLQKIEEKQREAH